MKCKCRVQMPGTRLAEFTEVLELHSNLARIQEGLDGQDGLRGCLFTHVTLWECAKVLAVYFTQ